MLSTEEKARYARHFTLPDIGMEGQERLKKSSVLCIGAGGLGSPSTLYLAAAGLRHALAVVELQLAWSLGSTYQCRQCLL